MSGAENNTGKKLAEKMEKIENIRNLYVSCEAISDVDNLNGHKTLSCVVHKKVDLVEVTTYVHGKVELVDNENLREAVVYWGEDGTVH